MVAKLKKELAKNLVSIKYELWKEIDKFDLNIEVSVTYFNF